MVFVKYAPEVKAIVVKLSQGMPLAEINTTIDQNVSPDSLSRWNSLYRRTRDVVRDPALYLDRGRPLAFSREEAEFVLTTLRAEPTLYLNEIQSHIQAITGTRHPISTIASKLKTRLLLTKEGGPNLQHQPRRGGPVPIYGPHWALPTGILGIP